MFENMLRGLGVETFTKSDPQGRRPKYCLRRGRDPTGLPDVEDRHGDGGLSPGGPVDRFHVAARRGFDNQHVRPAGRRASGCGRCSRQYGRAATRGITPGAGTAANGHPDASRRARQAATLQIPAVERRNIDDGWARSVPSAIPEEVLQALSRTGHQVQQRREAITVPMQDGRRLVVPVDHVDLHYVGNPAY